jgi:hypothetical protein
MKKLLLFSASVVLLSSCGNDVEEITDPSTGTVLTRYEYYSDENGQKVKDGEFIEWKKDGSIGRKENYKDGKLDGENLLYQSKDSIFFNYYKAGEKNGVCRLENQNGIVLSTYSYKDDFLTGATTYNYPSGKPYIKAQYDTGLPTGTWKYFNQVGKQTGTLTMNDNFIPNELVGKWWIVGEHLTFFEFKEDGYVGYWAPWNNYSNEPFEQMSGDFSVGRHLRLQFGNSSHGKLLGYDIMSIDKKEIVLRKISDGSEMTLEKM